MRLRLSALRRRSEGLAEAAASAGAVAGDFVTVEAGAFRDLKARFEPSPEVVVPQPFAEWPKWAKGLTRFRQPQDKGVGDTVHRMLGGAGVFFQATMAALGAPCGCDRRQAEWNARFPYQ